MLRKDRVGKFLVLPADSLQLIVPAVGDHCIIVVATMVVALSLLNLDTYL